jgi:hypothetical protein
LTPPCTFLDDLLSSHLSFIHLLSILFRPSSSLYSFSASTLRRSHPFHFACFRRVLHLLVIFIHYHFRICMSIENASMGSFLSMEPRHPSFYNFTFTFDCGY